MEAEEKNYCLYCDAELDYIPTEDGGFCSTECEDRWLENFNHQELEKE